MVYRIYVEKKQGLTAEADALRNDIVNLLGIKGLTGLRLLNRYDAEQLDKDLFDYCTKTVFSEPQLDDLREEIPTDGAAVFAVEYLPGQFDQRANSAAECIQIISKQERPLIKTAKVYVLYGNLSREDVEEIKKYLINPVESREASLDAFDTLDVKYEIPTEVATVEGFCEMDEAALAAYIKDMGLAMDLDDIKVCQKYFLSEQRDPTITEIKMIDTYWSDHCRHTTFQTTIDSIKFEDATLQAAYNEYLATREAIGRTKPINLMDMGTIVAKFLKKEGKLDKLDESEEINACTVKIDVDVEGKTEKWLLLFKNETHNHPTEIEPFGGAATCVGGAIRDPLSGRSYVYTAMRVTGAGNPLTPVSETLRGKLPQRKIVTTAAAGYSSYGNQIGLATGLVDEMYHPGYAAKRLEIGAVVGATPEKNVRREVPAPGDKIVLLGGRTGRDGCGGATGSSKSHKLESIETCGAEVQKGNAPTERKLQRLFRDGEVTRLIKRCNDFGAGGVSVAIGELADGLMIDLDKVPKKYDGLDGTELAISESQERMAVVLAPEDVDAFLAAAKRENLEATVVAEVTAEPRLRMTWKGVTIVDLSREFLNSNGAEKHTTASVPDDDVKPYEFAGDTVTEKLADMLGNLNICSKQGLSERFDSTIGAATVLMPFGGKYQLTPNQTMVAKLPVLHGTTDTVSGMAYGMHPEILSQSPYEGSYLAVIESVTKLVCAGFDYKQAYLTFQEYFERMGADPTRWGKPFAALLGALDAQLDLNIAAIGGKDSMSGTFEKMDVPPTLCSFAIAPGKASEVISPEFKEAGHAIRLVSCDPHDTAALTANYDAVLSAIRAGKVVSAWALGLGGVAEGLFKMGIGNQIGTRIDDDYDGNLFAQQIGAMLLECTEDIDLGVKVGDTVPEWVLEYEGERIDLTAMQEIYEGKLDKVFSYRGHTGETTEKFSYSAETYPVPAVKTVKPLAFIPVFPGTNCEYDTARAVERAGGAAEILVINNLTPEAITQSIAEASRMIARSQMIVLPGGFSGGDEPDGSAKFITAFFRNPAMKDAVHDLLQRRDGLMLGICNGFQALIKLGLVPYGEIIDTSDQCPTLTFNEIGRHQSMLVRTRIASNKSPWLSRCKVDDIHTVAISHGEGRFVGPEALIRQLAANGQIATQYVDLSGAPSMDMRFNPNASYFAIEGITSPDGRVLGKMGHTERSGENLYKNVPGDKYQPLFEGGMDYFRL